MRKSFFLFYFFLIAFTIQSHAQNNEHELLIKRAAVNEGKEKIWVDSVKRQIKKYERDQNQNSGKKYLTFTNNCVALGLYYEKKFDAHELPDMKKAIYWYHKVADFSYLSDDEAYYPGAAVKTTLYRKLADIYFKGKGTKRDVQYSLRLALEGIGNNGGLFSFYSKRYYGCDCLVLDSKTDQEKNYSKYTFTINPFARRAMLSKINIDKLFERVVKKYKLTEKTNDLFVTITSHAEPSSIDQARCNRINDNLKTYLVEKGQIREDHITTNCAVDDEANQHIIEIELEMTDKKIIIPSPHQQ